MPLFYLNLCNGQGFLEDEEGEDYVDLAAATQAAIKGLREAMAADLLKGRWNSGSYMEIEDAQHQHLVTIQFGDIVEIETVCVRKAR